MASNERSLKNQTKATDLSEMRPNSLVVITGPYGTDRIIFHV